MSRRVVITIGDPAGCGPVITVKALGRLSLPGAKYIVIADKKILDAISVPAQTYRKVDIIDVMTPGIMGMEKGQVSELAGRASLNYLEKALAVMKREDISSLVTAPVSKEAVQLVCPGFTGHTEYLAGFFKVSRFCMLMVSPSLKVALLTRHIPLGQVPLKITARLVTDTAELVYGFLKNKLKVSRPKIAVAGVNPHAGVDTFLGKEEQVIAKAIAACKIKFYGPYPSDTLFIPQRLKEFDCVLCSYHDQGMIPFKLLSFTDGVNVTVGLPVTRTSPAHGVAFDAIKKKESLMSTSMEEAIKYAYRI